MTSKLEKTSYLEIPCISESIINNHHWKFFIRNINKIVYLCITYYKCQFAASIDSRYIYYIYIYILCLSRCVLINIWFWQYISKCIWKHFNLHRCRWQVWTIQFWYNIFFSLCLYYAETRNSVYEHRNMCSYSYI